MRSISIAVIAATLIMFVATLGSKSACGCGH